MKKTHAILFLLNVSLFVSSRVWASDVIMKMTSDDGSTAVEFQNASNTQVGAIDSTGELVVSSNVKAGGYVSVPQVSNPGAASSGRVRMYAKDVGGETYLAYIDSTGRERIVRAMRDYVVGDSDLTGTNMGTTYKDVHYGVSASALSRVMVNFDGYTEVRIIFAVDNNEADSIQCRLYNETTAAEITSAISDTTGNAQLVTGSWTSISLTGDNVVSAQCREGTGATADPDIGVVHLQIR
jgi:hypothetical protein